MDLVVRVPEGTVASQLRVWNYNRSFLDAVKGVKDMQARKECLSTSA